MRFIGITGGVGSGKSELLNYIGRHYSCEIYRADEVAHLIKKPGTECYRELIDLLGEEILLSDGTIDKKVMADKIFKDKALLCRVNELVHPAVRNFLLERLKEAEKKQGLELFFVEAALLLEAGYGKLVDEMWYVYANEDVRRRRLELSRGYSPEKTERIMDSQLSEEDFRRACDFVIDNSGSLKDSCRQIDKKLEAFTWRE